MLSYIGKHSDCEIHGVCCNDVAYGTATHYDFRPREIQQIVRQVVAYERLKTIENYKQSSLKVVVYERWSPTRGSIYSDLTRKLLVFWKSGR